MSNVTPIHDEPAVRELPHNAEIEAALLAALLVSNAAFDSLDFLAPDHFHEPAHGRIFDAIAKMIDDGQAATPASLRHYFDHDEALAARGGGAYLFELAANAVTVVNARAYAVQILDLYQRRQLIALGQDLADNAQNLSLDETAADIMDSAEGRIDGLRPDHMDSGPRPVGNASARALATTEAAKLHGGDVTGIATGITRLDRLTGGLHRQEAMLLAGRPSQGKTALAATIAWNIVSAETPGRVAFFSLEMGDEQVAQRLHAGLANVDLQAIRRGDLNDVEMASVRAASARLAAAPELMIDETPALTLATLKSRARRLKRRGGLDVVMIDYVQLVAPSAGGARGRNREQEVSEISRGLKTLAKELDVAVVALSQLSRKVEERDDKRPLMSDLRDSGSLEQDADAIVFVYRHYWYVQKREPLKKDTEAQGVFEARCDRWSNDLRQHKGKATLILAKQRQGPTGEVTVGFEERRTWFHDLGEDRQEGMEF